ncbi:RNA polymerase, sigma 54 (sigma N) factor [Candidatus Nitrotoga sp. HW29]|uniref:RNA polymerase factor sigma-54 n=1 Tax=Candidatus Nitrotoga sp. HW29 TaxID=2886963 RepID=UPI001EF1D6E5|nr:RNA polymerase factor sigma-54 [Candidatus Nitrotoga sp. HW29]CAH1904341.1 RNA polymerase, sigma 54 (sigma N) factor [Candidatus Nitrotoga sp. HW29]
MKPTLQLRQSQQLTLTPQLQQAIRLLQLSTLEVNQEVARLLDENPLLEREDEDAMQPYAHGDAASSAVVDNTEVKDEMPQQADEDWVKEDWNEPSFSAASGPDDEKEARAEVAADTPSLREHLIWQLNMSQHDVRDRKIIGLLIDALDGNGYLAQPLEEIVEMLPEQLDITLDDLETALVQLQHLDQPGIAARTLSECLMLQLKALPEDTPYRDLALRLVSQYLNLLAAHDFTKLKKVLRCDDDALRTVQSLITHLQPRPGAEFEQRAADYVVPDVVVEFRHGNWHVRLNQGAMPRLRVNQMYANILQHGNEKNVQQLAGQLQEARWFIKNLQQRFDTILRVSQTIIDRQRNFLEHGDTAMCPLVLREIAEQLDLHESTISRVTTQKFMLTPRGIYELKYFFCSGIATESGGTCSSTAIRALIKQLVNQEDARHPLTDSRMSEILAQQGILVARRTVAKYRELLNILPVNLRKSL